jgi:hypothetical protein
MGWDAGAGSSGLRLDSARTLQILHAALLATALPFGIIGALLQDDFTGRVQVEIPVHRVAAVDAFEQAGGDERLSQLLAPGRALHADHREHLVGDEPVGELTLTVGDAADPEPAGRRSSAQHLDIAWGLIIDANPCHPLKPRERRVFGLNRKSRHDAQTCIPPSEPCLCCCERASRARECCR